MITLKQEMEILRKAEIRSWDLNQDAGKFTIKGSQGIGGAILINNGEINYTCKNTWWYHSQGGVWLQQNYSQGRERRYY